MKDDNMTNTFGNFGFAEPPEYLAPEVLNGAGQILHRGLYN